MSAPSRGLAHLGDIAFWSVFSLAAAIASPPIAVWAACAGIVLAACGFVLAGRARSPEAADDIGFTRIFFLATVVVYAVIAATGWEIGMWVMMLCGMFLLHCVRNLMIVEKLLVKPVPPPAVEEGPASAREIFEALEERLEEVLAERASRGVDGTALAAIRDRLRESSRRQFLLSQRGALFLSGERLNDVATLEADLAEAEQEGGATPRELRKLKAESLRRILDASRRSHADVARLTNAADSVEEVLADLERWLAREDFTEDVPGWLAAAAPVLEATLSQAEEALAPLEEKSSS